MSAFGDGIEIMTVINPKTLAIGSATVAFRMEGNQRIYKWETADITAVQPATVVGGKISPAKLLYPSRQASLAEMSQMARFADYSRHDRSATKQLWAFVYFLAKCLMTQQNEVLAA